MAEAKKTTEKKTTAKKPTAPLPVCMCACGETCSKKGSKFRPGHDARLRGRLQRLRKAEKAKDNKESDVPQKDRDEVYKKAMAELKGVNLDEAYKWFEATF